MTDSKLRIPRVALAVLVLGAACGDDEKGSSNGGGRDAGGGGHDPEDGEHDAGDDHQGHDAGGTEEIDGGSGHQEHDAGNGEEDGGAANVIDVSQARIQRVADDFCSQGFRCEVEEVVGNFDDAAACVADSESYWESYIATLGEDCIDAQLDLYACAGLLSCDEDIEHACHELIEATAELCASEG